MSQFRAVVSFVKGEQNLHVVSFDFAGINLKMMSLELPHAIREGREVLLGVKPSHTALAKEFSGMLSYSNQLKAKVVEIEQGVLLANVKSEVNGVVFESLITLDSLLRMQLHEGDAVTLLIKASELFIVEILDDRA